VPLRLFIFIQLEFPWALGPADGRYLVRLTADAEPERVVVIETLAAPRAAPSSRGRRGSRGGTAPASSEPATVSTTRVTVIDPISLSAEQQARAWLDDLDRDHDVPAAVATVNRVLHLHRIASADPHVHELSPSQALVIRAGWGEGEQVASGNWMHARELPVEQGRRRLARARPGAGRARSLALRPQERLAALLGARSDALLCEELTLRARLDLDQGRVRHAALELENAFAAAVPELRAEGRQDLALRIAELEQLHEGVSAQALLARPPAAAAAGEEPMAREAPDEEIIRHGLERLEAALRARSATGFSLK
jgi:hypothetical protein